MTLASRFILISSSIAISAVSVTAQTIAQWNFNSLVGDANTGTGSLTPSIGTGTASLFGGTTASFASGDASGGSSDPASGDDSAWNITTFAASATGDRTRGVQFDISTSGFSSEDYTELVFRFDQRFSNTAANTASVQFTTNGSTWTEAAVLTFTPAATGTGDTWFNSRTVSISAPGAFNNASFGLRVLAAFDPVTGNYLAARSTSSYGTSSTWRFDMVTLEANPAAPIPEPSSFAALAGLGVLGASALRRRRRA